MHGFWKNWMTAWCWLVLVFGVVLALVATPMTDAAVRFVFALISRDPSSDTILAQPPMRFAIGLQGALTIGWALTIFGMARAAETSGAAVWRALTVSLVAWYVIDSAISVLTGFPLNALSNTLLMSGYLAPVLSSGVLSPRQSRQPRPA